jgi:transcriptional regulator with XRE-family HTH domain
MAGIGIDLQRLATLQASLTNQEFARKLGLDPALIGKLKKGRLKPGEKFISRILAAFPGVKFDDLFYLEAPPDTQQRLIQEG